MKTISAYTQKVLIKMFRPSKKYSSSDTVPLNYKRLHFRCILTDVFTCPGSPCGATGPDRSPRSGAAAHAVHQKVSFCPFPYLSSFSAVFRIHDILVWMRIRIRGWMPLTNGSGSLLFSPLTFKMPTKINLKKSLSAYYFFKGIFTSFLKIKSPKEVTKQ